MDVLNAKLGSFSRSAVNNESEAKTGLSGLITGIIIGCSLLFLTPVFKYIPQVCLHVVNIVVYSTCCSLRNFEELRNYILASNFDSVAYLSLESTVCFGSNSYLCC